MKDFNLTFTAPKPTPTRQMKNFMEHHALVRTMKNGVRVFRRLPSWYSTGPGRRPSHG